jgi:hypothetical protein
VPFFNVKLILP